MKVARSRGSGIGCVDAFALTACHSGDSTGPTTTTTTTTTLVWSSVYSGTTEFLEGVWGTSASDVWAVGFGGTILHYNGTTWSSVSGGDNPGPRQCLGHLRV